MLLASVVSGLDVRTYSDHLHRENLESVPPVHSVTVSNGIVTTVRDSLLLCTLTQNCQEVDSVSFIDPCSVAINLHGRIVLLDICWLAWTWLEFSVNIIMYLEVLIKAIGDGGILS